jgi:hypothetical protein
MTKFNADFLELLENAIDEKGLPNVLESLEQVCYEKAAHLRSNWQDESGVQTWERAARKLSYLANNPDILATKP